MTHLPLDRSQAQPDPLLVLELLPNHIGIAGARHLIFEPAQPPATNAIRHPAALGQISANRHVAAPQLARDHTPPRIASA
jgi:hypothetical protein